MTLNSNDYPSFRFQPATPLQFKSVQTLTFHLISLGRVGPASLQLYLWNAVDGGWGMVELQWGDNAVRTPEAYVTSEGDIYAAVRNRGDQTVVIDNMGFTILVVKPDGAKVIYGLTER